MATYAETLVNANHTQQDLEDFASFMTPAQARQFWADIAAARAIPVRGGTPLDPADEQAYRDEQADYDG